MSKRRILTTITLIMAILSVFVFSGCTIRGMSAYEIAVRNGFIGTEAEWLHSLKGSDGSDITVEDLFEQYLQQNPDATYDSFLTEYLTFEYTPTATAAAKALRSSVRITAGFQKASDNQQYSSGGSGVIYNIDNDGTAYILTNYHVIYDSSARGNGISTAISVFLYGKDSTYQVNATFLSGSEDNKILKNSDIALLKTTSPLPSGYQAAEIADSNNISVGQPVIVAGNPAGMGIAVTSGIISVDSEHITMSPLDFTEINLRVIRIDAAVNRGNSGGGLFDSQGRLIGIVNAKIIDESIENIGYAIPSNIAAGIAYNMLNNGGSKKVLGITTVADSSSMVYNSQTGGASIKEDIVIYSITSGSLAAMSGLKVGDILLSASLDNGGSWLPLNRNFYLSDYLYYAKDNDKLLLKLSRGGTEREVSIQF